MILLAIETGMPGDADALVEALASGPHATLGEFAAGVAPDVEPDTWAQFKTWVQDDDRPERRALRKDLFAQWTPLVGQFSFRVDGRGA